MDPNKIGMLSAVRGGVTTSVAIDSADVAPSLVTQNINGVNVPIVLKRPGSSLDQTDDGEDNYMITGSAPPKADDFVAILATGLGAVDANGVVLGNVQVSIGGVPAEVMLAYLKSDPNSPVQVYKIIACVPDIPSDSGDSKPQALVIAVNGSISGFGSGVIIGPLTPILRVPFFVSTVPPGLTVKVQGSAYTYVPPAPLTFSNAFQTDNAGKAGFDVVPLQQFLNGNTYVRFDFASWNFGGSAQQTRSVGAFSDAIATFTQKVKITVTGATISPSSTDGFYAQPVAFTLTPSCPAGQMFDHFNVAGRSVQTGNVFLNWATTLTQFQPSGPFSTFPPTDFTAVCVPLANSCPVPAAQYELDSVTGPIVDSINAINGTVSGVVSNGGTPVRTSIAGKFSTAANFNGSVGVTLPDNRKFDGVDQMSIVAWVKLDGTKPMNRLQTIFGRPFNTSAVANKAAQYYFGVSTVGLANGTVPSSSAGATYAGFYVNDGKQGSSGYYEYVPGQTPTLPVGVVPVPRDNNWHCVAMRTRKIPTSTSGDSVDFFVDGSTYSFTTFGQPNGKLIPLPQVGPAVPPQFLPYYGPWIGSAGSTTNFEFIGGLDRVSFFDRTLTDAEVGCMCGAPPAPIVHTITTAPLLQGLKAGPDGSILVAPQTANWVADSN